MAQDDLNSFEIDGETLCNLAIETCALAAESRFQNIDLITRATAYFLEALKILPGSYKLHLGFGILLLGGQMYTDAIKYLQSAHEINPSCDALMYLELAQKSMEFQQRMKVDSVLNKKKATVNDLIDLSNKFKQK